MKRPPPRLGQMTSSPRRMSAGAHKEVRAMKASAYIAQGERKPQERSPEDSVPAVFAGAFAALRQMGMVRQ